MATREAPLLEIRNLQSWYDTPAGMVRAVLNMSLAVLDGQAVGIVGESGSGKTQTFFSLFALTRGWPGIVGGAARFGDVDILAGIERYVRVIVNGDGDPMVDKDEQKWNAVHRARLKPVLGRAVAMMFQEARASLVPYWTIRQHLTHVLDRRDDVSEVEAEAAGLLATFGFRDPRHVLNAFPEQLSGGEAQRATLALAMAARPRLLIADEPTTALDAVNQMRVLAELERVHDESALALVLISHDLAVVERVAKHVIVVFGGAVVERAPASVLAGSSTDEIHPYAAELRDSQRRRAGGLPIAGSVRAGGSARRLSGCPYANRCSMKPRLARAVQARCDAEFPEEVRLADDHAVACWGMVS